MVGSTIWLRYLKKNNTAFSLSYNYLLMFRRSEMTQKALYMIEIKEKTASIGYCFIALKKNTKKRLPK
ncbi:MAG: hypothetical protein CSA50_00400 [Gammaproteobacteria bacterium]|nr:MAG: hypothetical protein CSA50_00400 [Gammaproteobacteria bacterium]